MDSWKKGQNFERECSKNLISFEKEEIPLLVCPRLLRKRNLGQVDLAKVRRPSKDITIYELKSDVHMVSFRQKRRLMESCQFIGTIFQSKINLEFIGQEQKN